MMWIVTSDCEDDIYSFMLKSQACFTSVMVKELMQWEQLLCEGQQGADSRLCEEAAEKFPYRNDQQGPGGETLSPFNEEILFSDSN